MSHDDFVIRIRAMVCLEQILGQTVMILRKEFECLSD